VNVIVSTQIKIQKGQFLLPFFLSDLKIFNEAFNECSMNSEYNNYLNKKYEIVVTIKTIITQIERLARSCFSLEFECKKLGSTNINTPIK